jgi:hypothetical protein
MGEIQETHYYQWKDDEQKQDFLWLVAHAIFVLI